MFKSANAAYNVNSISSSSEYPDIGSGSHISSSIRESDKEEMLDEICDPEPMSGYSLLDEMEFTLYAALADLNKLQKLIFLYKEQQE